MAHIFLFIIFCFVWLVLIGIIIISIIGIYLLVSSSGFRTPPAVPTSGRIKKILLSELGKELRSKKNQTVVDLGSGWGTLLIPLARKFPNHKFIGVEKALLPYVFSKIRASRLENVSFCHQNFFSFNLSDADIVISFLMKKMMLRIRDKCQAEMKHSSMLYCNRFPLPDIRPIKKISLGTLYETIYKYRF